ncbi:uncharacterized mitochondrial protein-like protein [Tanacetum coccineum]
MIGTLLYLTAIRPDLQFAICMCAWYQARLPKSTYMRSKGSFDADHAGCQDTRRSTSGSMQFLGDRLVSWSSKRQKSIAISSTEAITPCRFHARASNEEIKGPMKDQPLSADASPTALSPGYIANSDPEEDKEDPEEDPADHPADG